ncbi:MAG: hypothetical protein ACRET4_10205 [Steroidobacteraceae bacterium]
MAALALVSILGGCATSIAYRADYVPDKPIADADRIKGRILIYTTKADDERLVTGGATSFTGSGAKLTTPIGMMTREIALKVFSRLATDGAQSSNDLADSSRFTIVLRPEVQDFKYGFPQLKNLGFAITPQVEVTLRAQIIDSSGHTQFEQTYSSGVVEGKSYMMSGSPYERINKLVHATIYDLMVRAAADVKVHLPSS